MKKKFKKRKGKGDISNFCFKYNEITKLIFIYRWSKNNLRYK